MEVTFDVSEKDLAEFGEEIIRKEFKKTLKWLRLKQAFKNISDALKEMDEQTYHKELEKIRESAWAEYQKASE